MRSPAGGASMKMVKIKKSGCAGTRLNRFALSDEFSLEGVQDISTTSATRLWSAPGIKSRTGPD